ncbi:hypothetical protein TREES_T100009773 [Tupaia chinensis]|uniref:Uncharacterized protein n=1 Tax=Tupaia chinensis TaxID=246437 RepID=L9KVJ8_TUPCH|nr:hypothetical protein TREES_T100009773 [Tupaia chinensis]
MSSGHGVDYATGTQMTKDALCNAAKVKEEAFEEQMLALELDLAMADVENILRMEHYTRYLLCHSGFSHNMRKHTTEETVRYRQDGAAIAVALEVKEKELGGASNLKLCLGPLVLCLEALR